MNVRSALLVSLALIGCKKESSNAPSGQASGAPPGGSAAAPPVAPAGSDMTVPSGTATGSGSAAGSGSATGGGAGGSATRTVGPFTEVHIGTSLEADIDIGPQAPLQITGEDRIVAVVITEVKGNVLDIRLPDGHWEMKQPLVVHIKIPSLTAVEAETSGTVIANGLAADKLTVKAETSAEVTLKGTCKSLDAKAETSGKLDAGGLTCENVKIEAETSGDATINATASATGNAETSGHVHVTGNPKQKNIKTETSGSVD